MKLVSHTLPTGIGYPPKPCPLRFINFEWWTRQELNLRPSACKADALPTELRAHSRSFHSILLLFKFLVTSFNDWSRWQGSNPRPSAYKAAALPTELHRRWSSGPASNRRPPAYEADALPAELPERWSSGRGSNPRPHPYQGCALPTELPEHGACSGLRTRDLHLGKVAFFRLNYARASVDRVAGRQGLEP